MCRMGNCVKLSICCSQTILLPCLPKTWKGMQKKPYRDNAETFQCPENVIRLFKCACKQNTSIVTPSSNLFLIFLTAISSRWGLREIINISKSIKQANSNCKSSSDAQLSDYYSYLALLEKALPSYLAAIRKDIIHYLSFTYKTFHLFPAH